MIFVLLRQSQNLTHSVCQAALCSNLNRNQDIHLSCQLSVRDCSTIDLSGHNVWHVNGTELNAALYNLSTTCTNVKILTTSLIFTFNTSTHGCYQCNNTSSLLLHSGTRDQLMCEVPFCTGFDCSDPGSKISTSSTSSIPSLQRPQISSSITTTSTTQQLSISALLFPSSTQAVLSALVTSSPALSSPTPAPSQSTLQIPLSIVYAAGACILLLLIVFVLVLALTCTISCWKKQSSLRITGGESW